MGLKVSPLAVFGRISFPVAKVDRPILQRNVDLCHLGDALIETAEVFAGQVTADLLDEDQHSLVVLGALAVLDYAHGSRLATGSTSYKEKHLGIVVGRNLRQLYCIIRKIHESHSLIHRILRDPWILAQSMDPQIAPNIIINDSKDLQSGYCFGCRKQNNLLGDQGTVL